MVIWVKSIGRKLFDVALGESSEFCFPETLGKVEESLGGENHGQNPKKTTQTHKQAQRGEKRTETDLIIFHLSVVDIQF